MKKITVLTFSLLLATVATGFAHFSGVSDSAQTSQVTPDDSSVDSSISDDPAVNLVSSKPKPKEDSPPNPKKKLAKTSAYMVTINRNLLDSATKTHLEEVLARNEIPPTAIGDQCSFYEMPEMWCNIQRDESKAKEIFNYLNKGPLAEKVAIQAVRRIGQNVPNGG